MPEIRLTPEMQKFIDDKVRSGQFASASDVVNDALLALQTQDELSPEDVDELRAEIAVGLEQADRGEFIAFSAETIIAEGRAILSKRQRTG
jgi:antitoxin ParD1/3/4